MYENPSFNPVFVVQRLGLLSQPHEGTLEEKAFESGLTHGKILVEFDGDVCRRLVACDKVPGRPHHFGRGGSDRIWGCRGGRD